MFDPAKKFIEYILRIDLFFDRTSVAGDGTVPASRHHMEGSPFRFVMMPTFPANESARERCRHSPVAFGRLEEVAPPWTDGNCESY
jgi:hypothetical protein